MPYLDYRHKIELQELSDIFVSRNDIQSANAIDKAIEALENSVSIDDYNTLLAKYEALEDATIPNPTVPDPNPQTEFTPYQPNTEWRESFLWEVTYSTLIPPSPFGGVSFDTAYKSAAEAPYLLGLAGDDNWAVLWSRPPGSFGSGNYPWTVRHSMRPKS